MMTKDLRGKLISLTWPIFIEAVLFSLLGGIDTLMIGRYSDYGVAALSVSNQIMFMVNLMFAIITTGTTILVSQYIGANRKNQSDNSNIMKLCGVAIGFNTFIGIILSILMAMFGVTFLKLLNTSDEILNLANDYLVFVGGFVFIQAIAMTFTAILRAYGKTKICMLATILMNLINVISNYILIFGNFGAPELGVAGAAISTTIGKVCGTILLGIVVYKYVLKDFSFKYYKEFPKKELKNILAIGIPSAGEQISYTLAQLVITSFINIVSINAMVTRGYIMSIVCYTFIFSSAVAQGSSIIIGQLIGEGKNNSAYKLCLYSLKKGMMVSLIASIAILIFGEDIFSIFTSNQEVISLGVSILIIDLFLELGRAANLIVINSLRATGDVKFPVYLGIFSMWVFAVGLGYILCIKMGMGLVGIWIALAVDEGFRGICVYTRWKSRVWQGRSFVTQA